MTRKTKKELLEEIKENEADYRQLRECILDSGFSISYSGKGPQKIGCSKYDHLLNALKDAGIELEHEGSNLVKVVVIEDNLEGILERSLIEKRLLDEKYSAVKHDLIRSNGQYDAAKELFAIVSRTK